jgi:D-hexose-6-phosphate mutarotase
MTIAGSTGDSAAAAAAELNRRFGVPGQAGFRTTSNGLLIADLANPFATGSICLQGGHLLGWQPRTQAAPVIWLSEAARFEPGRAIRGGVPVCWPWFGGHPTDASLPSHGFARTAPWTVTACTPQADGATRIALALDRAALRASLPPDRTGGVGLDGFDLELTATIGATLRVELVTSNHGDAELSISEALHAYFRVADVGAIAVDGLDGAAYIDQVDGNHRKVQRGAIRFTGEVDRVFVDNPATCRIDDPGLDRRIEIEKSGSRSTIVWSPAAEKAQRLGDLGDGAAGWRTMVCVESGNAFDDTVRVPAGASQRLAFEVRVGPLG